MTAVGSRRVLAAVLAALTLLFAVWMARPPHVVAAALVFVLPPALLCVGVLRDSARAVFWSGVAGLFWFSHGVMLAWSSAPDRGPALAEVALAVAAIVAGSLPGMRARFGRGRPRGDG